MVEAKPHLTPFTLALEDFRERGLLRAPAALEGLPGKRVLRQGRSCLNLSSNDYLGLAGHSKVKQAAAEAALRFGAGAGGSRLLGGGLPLHAELEAAVARMRPLGKALLFNTGFMANLGALQCLAPVLGPVFSDRLNHASITEALRLHPGTWYRYRHGDMDHLESLLALHLGAGSSPARRGLVCSETLFSMDGDFVPLEAMLALQKRYGFFLYLDEAHSTGCYPGFPIPAMEALPDGLMLMGTFGKAFGGFGAYVTGPQPIMDYLANAARSFIYSTALPPATAAAALAAMETADAEPWRREKLEESGRFARETFQARGLDIGASRSHIVPVLAGSSARALRVSEALFHAGYHAPAVRPPTVPVGKARLRINLTCEWERDEIAALAEALEKALAAAGPDGPEAGSSHG